MCFCVWTLPLSVRPSCTRVVARVRAAFLSRVNNDGPGFVNPSSVDISTFWPS